MKIFHVIEELSDKNNSIVSITKILTKYPNFKTSKIITIKKKYSKKNLPNEFKNKLNTINIYNKLFSFKSETYKFLKENRPDVVHIHGLWRPIHIIFILCSKQLGIPLIIQPHGMLLDEAIKSKSVFSYYSKLFVLFIYKFLLNNSFFIAVTNEEKKSINKYFKNVNSIIIPNPFISSFKIERKIKPHISFFGRFSPHKNLDIILKGFEQAKLNSKWKLIIYGIEDDITYKNKIKKIIKNSSLNNNVRILRPIFDTNIKFKKLSESFLNILMSKSEILSLSVLESLSVGTKSLVNSNIKYPKNISKLLYFAKPNAESIAKKLNEIVGIRENSVKKRKNIQSNFKKSYNNQISEDKYQKLTKRLKQFNFRNFEINFFNIAIVNGLNTFLIPYLVVIFSIIDPKISAEIGIIQGTIIFILQIFSSNSRVILLNENDDRNFENFVFFRVVISVLIILFFYYFFKDIKFIEENFHLNLILLVLVFWVNEITLIYLEKNKLNFFMKIYIYFLILFYILLTSFVFFYEYNFNNLFNYYSILGLIPPLYFFNLNLIFKIEYKLRFLYENLFSFLSTLSASISVLFWRYSILYFTNKELAGIIFAIFSIASFPGTFFNNILGQTILRQKKLKIFFQKYEKIFFLITFFIIGLLYIVLQNNNQILINNFILNTITLSFIGTCIMLISLRKRHKNLFQYFGNKESVFKRDIIYSASIFPLIIILYEIDGINGVSFAYFLSALISYFSYSIKYD